MLLYEAAKNKISPNKAYNVVSDIAVVKNKQKKVHQRFDYTNQMRSFYVHGTLQYVLVRCKLLTEQEI